VLRVRTAWQEPGEHLDPERLAETLRRTASWQGLGAIEVTDRGTAAPAVAGALGLPLVPHVSADDTDAAQPVARAEQDAAVDDAGDAR